MGGNIRQLGVAGFNDTYNIHWNWSPARFYETAVKDEGAEIAKGGALVVKTGKHTGRSALDKFVVRDEVTDCLLYTSPSPRDATLSRMPSSA